jgi:transcriptional regulator with XRE-family HTH domain
MALDPATEESRKMTVSDLIKRKREASKISQLDAAHSAGISLTTWNTMERGTRATSPSNIAAMAASLGITPEELENAAEAPGEYKAADVLRDMLSAPSSTGSELASRLEALLSDPPAGYEVATWQTDGGVFHVEFRPLAAEEKPEARHTMRRASGQ